MFPFGHPGSLGAVRHGADATVQYVTDDRPPQGTLTPSYARVSLAVITANREANLLGNVHGGEIMKLADSTAGAVAQRHSGGPAVTAAMDEMAFLQPVHVGDIVHTYAQVNWAGRSSMEIGVRVETEPWTDAAGSRVHVASAYFVFVAIDDEGRRARPAPGAPETPGRGTPDARGRDPPRAPAGKSGRSTAAGVAGTRATRSHVRTERLLVKRGSTRTRPASLYRV